MTECWFMVLFMEKHILDWPTCLLICIKLMTSWTWLSVYISIKTYPPVTFVLRIPLRLKTDQTKAGFYECHGFQHSLILEEKETSFPHLPQTEESFLFENKITICFKTSLQL